MKDLRHIAIIMDGNRRWAVENSLPKIIGHTHGAKNIRPIAEAAIRNDVSFLTLFTLSTENLKNRSAVELKHLYGLLEKIAGERALFQENDVRFGLIGDLSGLPEKTLRVLYGLKGETSGHSSMTLTIAVNYGGRDEIVRAASRLMGDSPEVPVTEALFSAYLDTAGMPDVDLLIRTAGHQRISNFLPWQSTYAELYFSDVKWPAFSPKDLDEAVRWFGEQQRNRGK